MLLREGNLWSPWVNSVWLSCGNVGKCLLLQHGRQKLCKISQGDQGVPSQIVEYTTKICERLQFATRTASEFHHFWCNTFSAIICQKGIRIQGNGQEHSHRDNSRGQNVLSVNGAMSTLVGLMPFRSAKGKHLGKERIAFHGNV